MIPSILLSAEGWYVLSPTTAFTNACLKICNMHLPFQEIESVLIELLRAHSPKIETMGGRDIKHAYQSHIATLKILSVIQNTIEKRAETVLKTSPQFGPFAKLLGQLQMAIHKIEAQQKALIQYCKGEHLHPHIPDAATETHRSHLPTDTQLARLQYLGHKKHAMSDIVERADPSTTTSSYLPHQIEKGQPLRTLVHNPPEKTPPSGTKPKHF